MGKCDVKQRTLNGGCVLICGDQGNTSVCDSDCDFLSFLAKKLGQSFAIRRTNIKCCKGSKKHGECRLYLVTDTWDNKKVKCSFKYNDEYYIDYCKLKSCYLKKSCFNFKECDGAYMASRGKNYEIWVVYQIAEGETPAYLSVLYAATNDKCLPRWFRQVVKVVDEAPVPEVYNTSANPRLEGATVEAVDYAQATALFCCLSASKCCEVPAGCAPECKVEKPCNPCETSYVPKCKTKCNDSCSSSSSDNCGGSSSSDDSECSDGCSKSDCNTLPKCGKFKKTFGGFLSYEQVVPLPAENTLSGQVCFKLSENFQTLSYKVTVANTPVGTTGVTGGLNVGAFGVGSSALIANLATFVARGPVSKRYYISQGKILTPPLTPTYINDLLTGNTFVQVTTVGGTPVSARAQLYELNPGCDSSSSCSSSSDDCSASCDSSCSSSSSSSSGCGKKKGKKPCYVSVNQPYYETQPVPVSSWQQAAPCSTCPFAPVGGLGVAFGGQAVQTQSKQQLPGETYEQYKARYYRQFS